MYTQQHVELQAQTAISVVFHEKALLHIICQVQVALHVELKAQAGRPIALQVLAVNHCQ